jgi:hypothetical protein
MNPNSKLDLVITTAGQFVVVVQRLLDFHSTEYRLQRTLELYQEGIAYGLDFLAVMSGKDGPQELIVFLQNLHRKRFIILCERRVTHDIGKHYCSESPLALGQGFFSAKVRTG